MPRTSSARGDMQRGVIAVFELTPDEHRALRQRAVEKAQFLPAGRHSTCDCGGRERPLK